MNRSISRPSALARAPFVVLASAAFVLAAVSLDAAGAATPANRAQPEPSRSDKCGSCHRDIYRMWRASAHSNALEDPIFLEVYRETEAGDPAVARVCLDCHAPTAGLLKDFKLERKITWEGIGCDLCHSITQVELTPHGPRLSFDFLGPKRGTIQDAVSPEHEVAYSPLHASADICAGCHEYWNPEGVPIMTTFSEWKKSDASTGGKICQDCHMSRTKADVVDPRVLRVPEAQVNLHEVPGGHSIDQLNRALSVEVHSSRDGDRLRFEVALRNKGAGHNVPTGMPGRRVLLDFSVRSSDGRNFTNQRVYAANYVDAAGRPIERDSGYFGAGVKLAGDTRIQPGEERVESFEFEVPAAATAFATLKLHYEHSPTGTKEGRTWITFFSQERTIEGGQSAVR